MEFGGAGWYEAYKVHFMPSESNNVPYTDLLMSSQSRLDTRNAH